MTIFSHFSIVFPTSSSVLMQGTQYEESNVDPVFHTGMKDHSALQKIRM